METLLDDAFRNIKAQLKAFLEADFTVDADGYLLFQDTEAVMADRFFIGFSVEVRRANGAIQGAIVTSGRPVGGEASLTIRVQPES